MNKSGPSDNEIKEMARKIALKLIYVVPNSARRNTDIIKYIDKEKLCNDTYPHIYKYLYDLDKLIINIIKEYKKDDKYTLEQKIDIELSEIICSNMFDEYSLMYKILQPYIKIAGGVHYSDADCGIWEELDSDIFNCIKKTMIPYYINQKV